MQEIKYEELDLIQQNLLDEAAAVMETAYNPYSHFYVGAALLSLDGQIITGSNVENAAYGSTICAERAAILRANAKGIRTFEKVAIIGRGESFDTTEVTAPCGSCRQMLFESSQVSERNLELIMATTRKDKIILATMEEILPLAFGPKDLGIDVRKYQ
ncbi:MAG TPA: cytidine deaminase [Nanoarchaeota archaeon]|nr:cytidine deaminase [Candidatus Pacearchaeota archaeon]HIH17271.1 cytidine deaminase [Nanoarchaeota archaeon]HIH34316.1 cytidine deaminase [Nanoarchaeota archaeon]HIH50826.1 cytidine deaminase [Nanoarchaeota archaeon]HIH66125.1 cytidine deaminase [Nanoarchaeota archaeon]